MLIEDLKKYSIDATFFVEVTRNSNVISRSDNPHADEDNDAYKNARALFITKLLESYEGDSALKCEKCSTELPKGYHVHHEDGDHTNNEQSNFRLRCPYCHLCSHLGYVGANGMGTMIYAPQIPQAVLNQFQMVAHCYSYILSTTNKTSKQYALLKAQHHNIDLVMKALEATKAVVLRYFQTTDPLHFANIFTTMSEDDYQNRAQGTFAGLRLLFDPSHFQGEIKCLAENVLQSLNSNSEYNPTRWHDGAKMLKKRGTHEQ